jgi:hypothetical protein
MTHPKSASSRPSPTKQPELRDGELVDALGANRNGDRQARKDVAGRRSTGDRDDHPLAVLRAGEAAAEIRAAFVAGLRQTHRLAVTDA